MKDRMVHGTLRTRYGCISTDEHGNTMRIYFSWEAEDVLCEALNMDVALSDREIGQVLDTLHATYDCSVGVSWYDVEDAIHDVVESRAKRPHYD